MNKKVIKLVIIAFIISVLIAGVSIKVISYSSDVIQQINQVIKRPSYDYLKSVTVRIARKAKKRAVIGTGSIVKITNDYTYILTNKHIAPTSEKEIYIINESNNKIKAIVLSNCKFTDLALIRVKGKLKDKTQIKKIGNIDYSNKVYSVGMYLTYNYIYTQGTMAGYDFQNNFIMNLPGSVGCSGSGVFNVDGELVAVVFGSSHIRSSAQLETSKLLCINTKYIKLFLVINKHNIK